MATLTRVGWADGQIVLAEDMIALEDNFESAIKNHVHGNGTVAAVLPQNIPAPPGAIGLPSNPSYDPTVSNLRDHLLNTAIHYRPNQNLPGMLNGRVSIPSLSGDDPVHTVDVEMVPGFTTTAYKVFLSINYPNATVFDLPQGAFVGAEILTAKTFRVQVRLIFNPFGTHRSFEVVWFAVGASSLGDAGVGFS